MKKIEYRIIDCFPKLAWVAVVDEKQNSITAYHGKYVECRSDWMIEGIWNGSFQEGNFHETALVFGTGVRIAEDKIYFVSSSSMADRLYYVFSGKKFLVSNSLPCFIALTDLDLDPVKDYAEFFQSLKKGFGKYEKELTARDQRGKIMNVLGENLVYQLGTVDVEKKPNIQKSCFSDFKSLKTFLRESSGFCKIIGCIPQGNTDCRPFRRFPRAMIPPPFPFLRRRPDAGTSFPVFFQTR